jgi:ABC-type antimicrobial peptide transport system permease subunit
MTVVGVVGRVKQEKLREDNAKVLPMGYLAYRERPNRHVAIVVKTTLPPETLARASREQLAAIDPSLPIYEVQTLTQMRDANIAPDRLNMTLLSAAALIALALAVVGIYGVVAFSVAQRQREIGVRMALGAQRCDVLNLILSHGMRLVVIGTVLGLVGAFGFGRVLASLLFQVSPTDPATLIIVPSVLIGAAALACALPARRAARQDPMELLRN